MKGYTPITTLKDLVYIYSPYRSDTEIAYLLNITEKDIEAVREEFKENSIVKTKVLIKSKKHKCF